jgi:site-specific DNA-cytosine methylase
VLDAALRALSLDGRYLAGFRLLCCRRHGDIYTTRERVFVVAVLRNRLRAGVSAQDFFPEERPFPRGRVVDILRHQPRASETAGLDVSRVEWLPARPTDDSYDGLRLVGRYDGCSEIGHHIYSTEGPAPTQRTGGTGPGLGTGLFWDDSSQKLFRLSPEQSLAVQSCDPLLYFKARALDISDEEIYSMAGNTIPVKTLRALVGHLLSLLRW